MELSEFENAVSKITTRTELGIFASKINLNLNPYFGYRIGEIYLLGLEDYKSAEPFFVQAIQTALGSGESIYLNSNEFSDSVGQSIFYTLQNHIFFDKKLEYNFTCLCYIYLSKSIDFFNSIGQIAYNSHYTRGRLISQLKEKNGSVLKMLKKLYYNGDDLCTEILSIGDFINAYIGFEGEGELENAEMAAEIYSEELDKITSLPQYAALKIVVDSGNISMVKKMSEDNISYFIDKLNSEHANGVYSINSVQIHNEFFEF